MKFQGDDHTPCNYTFTRKFAGCFIMLVINPNVA